MPGNKKLFLSAVSREFLAYRELLAGALKRPEVDIAVQEDFIVTGGSWLKKLDDYIRACDGVVHLIGKATGDPPGEPAVAALLKRYPDFAAKLPPLAPALRKWWRDLSYTQWEAYFAMYHDRPLFVYRAADFWQDAVSVPRDPRFVLDSLEWRAQRQHSDRIHALSHVRGEFDNEERLSLMVLRDLAEILPQPSAISETISASDRVLQVRHELPSALGDKSDAVPTLPNPQTVRTEGTHPILFLCYRREDTSDAAGRLHDRLVSAYGPDGVFMDIDSVPLGIDFVDHVSEQISKCRAVIVMIGRQWIKVKDKRRRRRLDDEDDLVRAEIAAALQQKVPVIPVLVQDAAMPSADELPENIRLLARRNGISLSASRWHTDVEPLMKELDTVMKR